jgi:hypothetical protein
MALQRLDFERRTIPDLDVDLETTPYVVRAISKLGSWNGIVYSHFPRPVPEAVITNENSYFATLGRSFEWKVYSHDEPPDLLTRLQNSGFNIGAEESLMILDLQELSPDLFAPSPEGITVTAVADDDGIGHFLSLEAAIWGAQADTSRAFLQTALEESISKRGLCCLLLNFQLLFVLHSRIPANEGLPELVIEHLRSDLQ